MSEHTLTVESTHRYVARHDVVYLSPPLDGFNGLPIGGGSWGGMIWFSESSLLWQLNHTDCYDSTAKPVNGYQGAILRSLGRLELDLGCPHFNPIYRKSFSARINLGEGRVEITSESVFGRFDVTIMIDPISGIGVIQIKQSPSLMAVAGDMRVRLERWGSPPHGWWYSRLDPCEAADLGRTRASFSHGIATLASEFGTRVGTVEVCIRQTGGACASVAQLRPHRVEIDVPSEAAHATELLLACRVGSLASSEDSAREGTFHDATGGVIEQSARNWWRDYWNRFFFSIGDDYVENLVYLHLFYMGCSGYGSYPAAFNGAIWLWNRDVRNWAFPHHWNTQQAYWGLLSANQPEIVETYVRTYSRILPRLEENARKRGIDGAILSEIHDFEGTAISADVPEMRDNFTQLPQVALMAWWHYRMTLNIEFLKSHGYPLLRSSAESLISLVEETGSGAVAIRPTSTYEDDRKDDEGLLLRFRNSVTTLSMSKAVFQAIGIAARLLDTDNEFVERCADLAARLPAPAVNLKDSSRGPTISSGTLVTTGECAEVEDHNHGPIFSPVFPANLVGLNDKGTGIFNAAVNSIETYPMYVNAITPTVVIAARLGLSEHCLSRIEAIVQNLQHFPNGLFYNIDHWFIHSKASKPDSREWAGKPDMAAFQRDYINDRSLQYTVEVAGSEDPAQDVSAGRRGVSMQDFIQAGLEPIGHLSCGVFEMLLQSHESVIRIFPSYPAQWEGRFSLRAYGGFIVSSYKRAFQSPAYVHIRALEGGRLVICNPWEELSSIWVKGSQWQNLEVGDLIEIDTRRGEELTLSPVADDSMIFQDSNNYSTNSGPKSKGFASLGLR